MSDYTTSIGLDVHARSIKGCAFNPYTGEVERSVVPLRPGRRRRLGPLLRGAQAVYESGVTGFRLCRELRALGVDCVMGAAATMSYPFAAMSYMSSKCVISKPWHICMGFDNVRFDSVAIRTCLLEEVFSMMH